MKWAIDRYDVAYRYHVLNRGVPYQIKLFLDRHRQPVTIEIVKVDIEGLHPPEDCQAYPAGCDGANVHPLHIIRPTYTIGDVPPALASPVVRGKIVSDK